MLDLNNMMNFIYFGIATFIANMSGGYRLDEQVKYPFEKSHIIKLSNGVKKFFIFKNKNRIHFFRAAVIQQIFGYFQLIFCVILGFIPNHNISLILLGSVFGLEVIYTLFVVIYYKVKYKNKKRELKVKL